MSAPHDAEHSLLARCQPTTRSPEAAISITHARPSHMPSTWTTCRRSSQTGATGQIFQYLSALRLNVRPPPGIAAWGDGDSSQSKNAFNPFAAESSLRVAVAPQDVHCQRLEPAAVAPWPFILPPHTGHAIFPMAELNHRRDFPCLTCGVKRFQGTRSVRARSWAPATRKGYFQCSIR